MSRFKFTFEVVKENPKDGSIVSISKLLWIPMIITLLIISKERHNKLECWIYDLKVYMLY